MKYYFRIPDKLTPSHPPVNPLARGSCRRPCGRPRLNVQSRLGASDVTTHVTTDTKLEEIIAEQEEIFVRRQPKSKLLAEQAKQHLTGGVTSSWQITAPQPVWLSHGRGSKVWDVDGNEYVDLHGGYGAALAGHAHPAIAEAVASQARNGTHFAQPTPDADHGGDRTRPQVRPPELAFRQLRHRSHHGRRAPDAFGHRPGPDHQDRGRLPRPPRLGAGLRRPRGRRRRPARKTQQRPLVLRHPQGHHRPDADRRVQRPG